MNYPMLRGRQALPRSCGREASANDAAAFWQSRMTRAGAPAPFPILTDLTALARSIRATWRTP